MISCQRALFDLPDDIAYFNCAYMSPLMKSVAAEGHGGVDRKARPWEIQAADFYTTLETARGLFARLLGAEADDIAAIPSASYGVAIAAANLPLRAGQKIIVAAEQFPSNLYHWRELAGHCGASVETVARPSDGDWSRALLAAYPTPLDRYCKASARWATLISLAPSRSAMVRDTLRIL